MIKRSTGLLVLEVRESNPNGDPDRESDPRQRPDQRGEISPVSVKRKIRDLVFDKEGPVWQEVSKGLKPENFQILESRGRDRKEIEKLIETDLDKFKRTYWDGRLFGNTFLEEGKKVDSIRTGTVHFGVGLSIAPIEIERMTLTNKSGVQEGKDRGMAPMGFRVVKHGIYAVPFFVNPTAAVKSGCEEEDVDLLCRVLPFIYDHTKSMVRSMVGIVHAWVVEHKKPVGSFSDFQMIDALTPRVKPEVQTPGSLGDYIIPLWTDLPESLRFRAAGCRDLMGD
jgi:Cas7 group CRISPR-associated protein Csh2